MPEDYDELIHGAFGDFTEDAESTITSRGSGDVRDKVARRRRTRAITVIAIVVAVTAAIAVVMSVL
jgi:hypothetical protein